MTRGTPQTRPASRFLRLTSPLLVGAIVVAAITACLVGAAGHWKVFFPAVAENTWLAVAGTLLAAAVAASIALFVLTQQLRAQEDRGHRNRFDDDERARRAHEVEAAASLSAHLGQSWPLSNSSGDFLDVLRSHGEHPPVALADLHRLMAVWINWTEDMLWPRARVHPRELLAATAQAGRVLHQASHGHRDVVARHILRDVVSEGQQNELDVIIAAHNYLTLLADNVVLMPIWTHQERAETIREWMKAGSAFRR